MFSSTQPFRIEWGHCDPAGIVFFPRYFEIFDGCANLMMERALGLTKFMVQKRRNVGGWPMVDVRATFAHPTRYGDDTVIVSSIAAVGRSSFQIDHKLYKDDVLCVEGFEKRVWVVRRPDDPDRIKSEPIPDDVRAKLLA